MASAASNQKEHTVAEPEYCGFWRRALAAYLDFLLIAAVVTPVAYLIYGTESSGSDLIFRRPAEFILTVLVPMAVIFVFWYTRQATPGKMLLQGKIVDAKTGQPPTPRQLLIRLAAYIVSALPLMLGFFWIGFNRKKQGWHDRLAGTVVIRLPPR